MKLLEFFELLFSVTLALSFDLRGLPSDNLQQQLSNAGLYSRISKGLTAKPNQFHYQVGLQSHLDKVRYFECGGSLISNEWVLTAAHCMENSSFILVYVGQITLKNVHNKVERPSTDVIEHDDYDIPTALHDIALIRISPVSFSSAIRPVVLPFNPVRSYFHVTGVLAGWGATSDSGTEPASLQYAIFKVISNADCAAVYSKAAMSEGKLCATAPRPTNGCDGDSGGALVVQGGISQFGILSLGYQKGCELGFPLLFTRVDHYLGWIREKTKLRV